MAAPRRQRRFTLDPIYIQGGSSAECVAKRSVELSCNPLTAEGKIKGHSAFPRVARLPNALGPSELVFDTDNIIILKIGSRLHLN